MEIIKLPAQSIEIEDCTLDGSSAVFCDADNDYYDTITADSEENPAILVLKNYGLAECLAAHAEDIVSVKYRIRCGKWQSISFYAQDDTTAYMTIPAYDSTMPAGVNVTETDDDNYLVEVTISSVSNMARVALEPYSLEGYIYGSDFYVEVLRSKIEVTYNGNVITSVSSGETKTLKTKGTWASTDISVAGPDMATVYIASSAGQDPPFFAKDGDFFISRE